MSKRIKGITIELDGHTKGLEKALKDINKESRDIQKELRDVDRLLRFNPKNTELIAQKQKLLGDQIETTKKKLEQLKGSQDQVTKAFEAGEISEKQYRDFQKEIAETESKLKHYETQLKQVDKTQRSFGEKIADSGKKVKEFGDGMTNVGKQMSMKVTAPLAGIAGVASKIGMDFKAGLSEVQALSGATGDDLANLEERARELGASTKFSAKEVTDGFKYMALAGWDVTQSLDAIDGVLDLAAASGEDLGRVSDILTDSISAFGDEAKDAARYADVLAAASSNSNTDVAGLGESFKMVAPIAGALGYSLEDTAVALGLMANAGIKGSQAGTTLRSALTNLTSPTAGMQKQMKKLGINIKDTEGNMKPLDVLLGDLRGSFSDLNEAEQASAASAIFGKQAMAGMLAVINAGEGDFDKLTKSIANSEGVAGEMADTMQNNLQGKLTNLKSALEELAIKIFDALEPALTAIVGGIQKFVDWLNGLNKGTRNTIIAIGALVAAIGPLLLILGPVVALFGSFLTVLPALIGPIGIVAGALAALGTSYALTRTKADESYQAQLKESESSLELAKSRHEAAEEITEQINKTTELIEKTKEQMDATDELVDTYEGLIDKSKLTTDEFGEFLTLQSKLENTKSPQRIEELEGKMEALRKKSGLSKDEFNRMLKANSELTEKFPEAGEVIDDYGNRIADTTGKLRDMTNAELERMQIEIYNEMVEDLRFVNNEIDSYNDLLVESAKLEDSIAEKKQETRSIQDKINSTEEEINKNSEKILELKDKQKDASLSEWWQLQRQWSELTRQNSELVDQNKKREKNLKTTKESLKVDEESQATNKKITEEIATHIDKNRHNYDMYVEILSKQLDVNIEKGNENKSIDEAIQKRKDEIKQLEEKIKKEGDSNGKLKESVKQLKEENEKLSDAKTKLDGINKSLDTQTDKYDTANDVLSKVNTRFSESGDLIDGNIKRADVLNDELNKSITKNVDVKDNGTAKKITDEAAKGVTKTVNIKTTGGAVLGALGNVLPRYAKGTNFHVGGDAILGDGGGPEIVEYNGRMSLAGLGVYNLPVGAKVHTHEDTVSMLRNGLVSGIGKGISLQSLNSTSSSNGLMPNDNSDLIRILTEQNQILTELLRKEVNFNISQRELTDSVNQQNALDTLGIL